MPSTYALVRSRSTAAEFHARTVPEPAEPAVWWHELTDPALVLGSNQRDAVADAEACRRAGVSVVRRRSGGGAVLLVPGAVTWVDVIVPAGAPGWSDDVHGPMRWLGAHLASLVRDLLAPARVTVHDGPMVPTRWSSLVCFDGVGVGEVLVDGAKLVGVSQRRTRHAARLQCCWYSAYDPAALTGLLAPGVRPPADALAPVHTVPAPIATEIAERLAAVLV